MLRHAFDGEDPTEPMIATHREISRLVGSLSALLDELPADGPAAEDHADLRRLLYGLHAILRLHFDQEEAAYLAVDDGPPESALTARTRQRPDRVKGPAPTAGP